MGCAFILDDHVQVASIVATSSRPKLDAMLLREPDLGLRWRSAETVNSASLIVDLGGPRAVGGVILLAVEAVADLTLRVRASLSDPTGEDGDPYDSGELPDLYKPDHRQVLHLFEAGDVTARYLRLDLDSATAGFLGAGFLLAGPVWRPSIGYERGFSTRFESTDDRTVTQSGVEYVRRGAVRRGWRGRFPAIPIAEFEQHVAAFQRSLRRASPVLFVPSVGAEDPAADAIVGRLQREVVAADAFHLHLSLELDILELK